MSAECPDCGSDAVKDSKGKFYCDRCALQSKLSKAIDALRKIKEKADVDKTSGGVIDRAVIFSIGLTAEKALEELEREA